MFNEALGLSNSSWFNNTIGLVIVLAISSPFIWGMLFSYRIIKLPDYAQNALNPAVFMIWLLTLAEVTLLSIIYFHSWVIVTLFLAIAIIFLVLSYRHLEKSYHWFEEQLISNIKTGEHEDSVRYEELAPWDTHLVEVEVGEHSSFCDKTLRESEIRQRFGVNIVAISHGSRIIAAPRGDERIISHDKLIVLGNDEQLDALKKELEAESAYKEPISFLDNFTLRAFL